MFDKYTDFSVLRNHLKVLIPVSWSSEAQIHGYILYKLLVYRRYQLYSRDRNQMNGCLGLGEGGGRVKCELQEEERSSTINL